MNIFELVVVQPIFNLLMGLYAVVPGGDFGVAIILFTIIIRFFLYPLTRSALHQSKAMRKLQPELAAIKKRTKGNRQQAGLESMELYKKHGVNPFRQIGILLIQLPIFIALYYSIQIFTTQRDRIGLFTYDFLEGLQSVKELITNPENFNETFLGLVDLTKSAFANGGIDIFLVLLAVTAGVTQYIMSKQTMPHAENKRRIRDIMAEAAEGKQTDQDEMNAIVMQRMSKVLPFFMFFIMLGFPGAIALYYAVSNLVAVAQQAYLLRQDKDELAEIASQPAAKSSAARSKPAKKPVKATPTKKRRSDTTVTRIVAKDTGKKRS
ncbi:MAG TPA: YidC/Oxa1 family membrane protein insertase [Candidatus Saccharibacteria bacterium]|nr:YidC/Oxa1 family membrane protein insertase [Candidatus Saccharibacteria bacterium]HRK93990.1 YidC/Oxa1 family membrane protein insertase [Candidatus Saccharibacteria bacterium]